VEARQADVIMVAFFDRFARSLEIQTEVTKRVEKVRGSVYALDFGEISRETAVKKITSGMLGLISEYLRDVTAERTQEAKVRAVARGVPPFPNIPPGYRRDSDGKLEPHPQEAKAVAEAFRLRSEGATVMEVRDHLRRHGINRSFHGTQSLLRSRVVLGELRFGETMVNLESHQAIVNADLWQKVQRMSSPRGPRPKSDRLLARLSVLRCGTCGARMVAGFHTSRGPRYDFYRCLPTSDCPKRMAIGADIAEKAIIDAVKKEIAGTRGTAGIGEGLQDAERDLEHAQHELDAAVEAFSGLEDVQSAKDKLTALREKRDEAQDRLAGLQAALVPAVAVGAGDWDDLTIEEQRALIVAVIDWAKVGPGKGIGRVTVQPRRQ
jgi:hypothetical protein